MPIASGWTMTIALKITIAALAAVLIVASAPQAWSDDDDCETAVENVDDAVQIASQALQAEMADIGKRKPETDKEKTALRNLFCISSGEFLGLSRAYRSVLSDCTRGSKRRNSLASLDESIATLQKSIKQTCE